MRGMMSFRKLQIIVVACATGVIGCGGSSGPKLPDPVKVSGVVALDSQPLPSAMVFFVPEGGKEMGNGATGITDANGTFELVTVRGKGRKTPGAVPGNYKVWISRLVGPDGSPIVPASDVPPADLGAVESLPSRYSDMMMTELKANVTAQGGNFDFRITSQ